MGYITVARKMDFLFAWQVSQVAALLILFLTGVTISNAQQSNLVSGQDSGSTATYDCYFCSTSHGDGGVEGTCGNNFDEVDLLQYANCAGVCTKNVIHAADTEEVLTINRLCEGSCPGNSKGHCTEASHGRKTCTYCCDSQLCNASRKPGVSIMVVVTSLLLAQICKVFV